MEETVRRAAAAGQTGEGTKVLLMMLAVQVTLGGINAGNQVLQTVGTASGILTAVIIFLEWKEWRGRNDGLDRPSALDMVYDRAVVWPVMYLMLVLAPVNMLLRVLMDRAWPGAGALGEGARKGRRAMLSNIGIAWLFTATAVIEAL